MSDNKVIKLIDDLDEFVSEAIKDRCSSEDYEINGYNLDEITVKAFKALGMLKTVEAFENVSCWRA